MYIQHTDAWQKTAQYFKEKSKGIFKNIQHGASTWGDDNDHQFLLQMWKDIYDAGFDGFMHIEFGSKVLALFDLKCIDKISVNPISMALNEKQKNRALKKTFKAKGQVAFPKIKSDEDIQNSSLNTSINDVLSAYKQKFDMDLSYMKFKVDS